MDKVHAIIIIYNPNMGNLKVLANALSSQVECVWVIDNGSKEQFILSDITDNQNIHLVLLHINVGIAKAQNLGVKYAKEQGADYFIFFDQDSVIQHDLVFKLKEDFIKISKKEKIAALGPIFFDTRFNFMYPQIILNKYGVRKRIVPTYNSGPLEVSFIISSGTLTSRVIFDDVGDMNEKFFIDYVDTEWCLRAKAKGYKIFSDTRVQMEHSIGDGNIKFLFWKLPVHSPIRRYYRMRNMYYLFKLDYVPFILKIREFITNTIHQLLITIASNNKKDYIKSWYKSQIDGLKIVFGKNL
jgi:rhamnosyltransferase